MDIAKIIKMLGTEFKNGTKALDISFSVKEGEYVFRHVAFHDVYADMDGKAQPAYVEADTDKNYVTVYNVKKDDLSDPMISAVLALPGKNK